MYYYFSFTSQLVVQCWSPLALITDYVLSYLPPLQISLYYFQPSNFRSTPPSSYISLLIQYSSSHRSIYTRWPLGWRWIRPNHLSQCSLILSSIGATQLSFEYRLFESNFLSNILVFYSVQPRMTTVHIHLKVLISSTPNLCTCSLIA